MVICLCVHPGGERVITIEQIDEFRKRTNSSYSDAKYFLEKNNGNILDAIIDFERTKAGSAHNHYNRQQNDMGKRFADVLQKGFDTRLVVYDRETVLFSVPVILLMILIPLWFVILLFFVFLAILGYRFRIQEMKSNGFDVHSFFKNINNKMNEYSQEQRNKGQQQQQNGGTSNSPDAGNTANDNNCVISANGSGSQNPDDDDDDDYSEFTVE